MHLHTKPFNCRLNQRLSGNITALYYNIYIVFFAYKLKCIKEATVPAVRPSVDNKLNIAERFILNKISVTAWVPNYMTIARTTLLFVFLNSWIAGKHFLFFVLAGRTLIRAAPEICYKSLDIK